MKIALSAKLVIVYFKQTNNRTLSFFPKDLNIFALDKQASDDVKYYLFQIFYWVMKRQWKEGIWNRRMRCHECCFTENLKKRYSSSWITAPPGSPLTEVVVSMQDGKTQQRWAWPLPSSTPPTEIEREVPTTNPLMLLSPPFPRWPAWTSDEGNTNIIILVGELLYILQECPCNIVRFSPSTPCQRPHSNYMTKTGNNPRFPSRET